MLKRLTTREPAQRWRAFRMALDGYGWEDICVASRRWPCGIIPRHVARRIVWKVQA